MITLKKFLLALVPYISIACFCIIVIYGGEGLLESLHKLWSFVH